MSLSSVRWPIRRCSIGRRALLAGLAAAAVCPYGAARAAGAARADGSRAAGALAPPIVIGALFNESGYLAPVDAPAARGVRLAGERIARDGGIGGRPLRVVWRDGGSRPGEIAAAARALLHEPGITALIGFCDNDALRAALPAVLEAGLPLVTPGATSPLLNGESGGLLLPACFTDNAQAAAAAEFARRALKAGVAYVVADEGEDYTRSYARYFTDAFRHLGGTVAGQAVYRTGERDVSRLTRALSQLEAKPDVLCLAAMSADLGTVVTALRGAGLGMPVIGGDSYDYDALARDVGRGGAPLYFTTHADLDPAVSPAMAGFLADYRTRFGQPADSAFAVLGYDALGLLAAAIAGALGDGGPLTPAAVLAAAPKLGVYAGVSGAISFTGADGNPRKPVVVMELTGDGRRRLARTLEPSYLPSA